jgi:anti-sigma regulatory factor (Ser/Thr protein kinase)
MAPLTGIRTPLIPAPRRSPPRRTGEEYAVLRLTADRTSVRTARRAARAELERWGVPEEVCDDVVLIVSELVTNAIVHAVSDVVVCRLQGAGAEVRVQVGAEGPSTSRTDARPLGECGRGLVVVEALSAAWGVDVPVPGAGWTAWATVAVPATASGAVPDSPAGAPAVAPAGAGPARPAAASAHPGTASAHPGTASGEPGPRTEVSR